MKTWRQIEAMANRQGLSLQYSDRTWWLTSKTEPSDDVARGDWWASGRVATSRILRAMCEAALREMGKS